MEKIFPIQTQNRKVKLLDRVREVSRFKHYSVRTEQAYVDWIKKFIIFHGKRHADTFCCFAPIRSLIFLKDVDGRTNKLYGFEKMA